MSQDGNPTTSTGPKSVLIVVNKLYIGYLYRDEIRATQIVVLHNSLRTLKDHFLRE